MFRLSLYLSIVTFVLSATSAQAHNFNLYEPRLRQCISMLLNGKTVEFLREEIYGTQADPSLRQDPSRWAALCQGRVGQRLEVFRAEQVQNLNNLRAQWIAVRATQPSPGMQACFNGLSSGVIYRENVRPLASTTPACSDVVTPQVRAGVGSVLREINAASYSGTSFCEQMVRTYLIVDPLTSPARRECAGIETPTELPRPQPRPVAVGADVGGIVAGAAGGSDGGGAGETVGGGDGGAGNGASTFVDAPVEAAAVVAPTGGDSECRTKLDDALKTLLKDDTKNVLGLQYELTALKLARIAQRESTRTLEDLVKKKKNLLTQIDDGTRTKLRDAYRKYGKMDDVAAIDQKISELAGKAEDANYKQGARRFFGEETSSFLLALQTSDPASGLEESDIAISWLMKQVQDRMAQTSGRFSANHNLVNLSSQVAALTGYIDPAKGLNSGALEARLEERSTELQGILAAFSESFKAANPLCFSGNRFLGTNSCWTVTDTVVPALIETMTAVSEEIRVAERTNIELRRGLGPRIAGYGVFFNRLALAP